MKPIEEHSTLLETLRQCQNVEDDNREKAREAHLFVTAREGQWEPYWWEVNSAKPRYTFDMTSPIIDQIAGEIAQADFDIKITPGSSDSSDEVAETFDGIVRHIESISGAIHIFNQSARNMITSGIDGWEIVQAYADDRSFDQDLMIKPIFNFEDRVWFDEASEKRDRSDAKYCFKLSQISKEEYEERWPAGAMQSVTSERQAQAYYFTPDTVMIGEYYYFKYSDVDLVLMSNNAVYEDDDDFAAVKDDLEAAGITELNRRSVNKRRVCRRLFDAGDWLEDSKETVFNWLPIVPTYGNFKILENKTLYHGAVEKLIDPQRVANYSLSREIEEGALAPRAKYWMTREQAKGEAKTLATLNTNADPVQFYTPDAQAPGIPMQQGGAQINPGLRMISDAMQQMIGNAAGLFAANMGANPGLQSGVAIEKLQNKGDNGTRKYFEAMEIAIQHTARVVVDAIPDVYGYHRSVRVLNEDGTHEVVEINQKIVDQDTGQVKVLRDLSQGRYDVTCSAGPSFKNRQDETVHAMIEAAQVDPTIIELGGDILLQNITAPGMSLLAERKREALFKAGVIPIAQMTEEEKQKAVKKHQEEQQQGNRDPAMVLAEAEMGKAQADLQKVQVDTQSKQAELLLQRGRLELDAQKQALEQQRAQLELEERGMKNRVSMTEAETRRMQVVADIEKKGAETTGISLDNQEKMAELERYRNMSNDELFLIAGGGGEA
jgi:hypothetical protein